MSRCHTGTPAGRHSKPRSARQAGTPAPAPSLFGGASSGRAGEAEGLRDRHSGPPPHAELRAERLQLPLLLLLLVALREPAELEEAPEAAHHHGPLGLLAGRA